MKNTRLFISLAVTLLMALCVSQAYLVYTNYRLEEELLQEENLKHLKVLQNSDDLDNFQEELITSCQSEILAYLTKIQTKKECVKALEQKFKDKNLEFLNILEKEIKLKKNEVPYEIQVAKYLKSLVLIDDSGVRDTLFHATSDQEMKIFGNDLAKENAICHNRSKRETESTDDSEEMNLHYELKTKSYHSVLAQDKIIFSRMLGVFLVTFFVFVSIVLLWIYSIRSLINQQQINIIKTSFINNITHELKTPLATLSIATKSLKLPRVLNSSELLGNTLLIVERQNIRLQKLFDQVLRSTFSYENLNKDTIADSEYFKNLLEDFSLSAKDKIEFLERDLDESSISLKVDNFNFSTVILNMLDNAVKYSPEKARIHFRTIKNKNNLCIQIKDEGLGLSKKDQKLIFDKFYRVQKGNRHDIKGLGLGLHYSWEIVRAHQGKIDVKSKENQGTLFQITLPLNV